MDKPRTMPPPGGDPLEDTCLVLLGPWLLPTSVLCLAMAAGTVRMPLPLCLLGPGTPAPSLSSAALQYCSLFLGP